MLREVGTKFVTFHQVWESFVAEALKVCNFRAFKILKMDFIYLATFILVRRKSFEITKFISSIFCLVLDMIESDTFQKILPTLMNPPMVLNSN